MIIASVISMLVVGCAAYRLGHARGLAQGMEWGATAVDDMRQRAMQLLQRSRVRYDPDDFDNEATLTEEKI